MAPIEGALATSARWVLIANTLAPNRCIREAIALGIHLVVHVERVGRARKVTDVATVSGYDPAGDRIRLDPLVSRVPTDTEGGVP